MPVDPGLHVVGARTPGRPSFEESLPLAEGEHRTSTIELGGGEAVAGEGHAPTVIVDPSAHEVPTAKVAEPRSRWVFEPGVFVGYLTVSTETARPTGSESTIAVTDDSRDPPTGAPPSCATVGCTYAISSQPGAVIGPNLFAGCALSDDFTAGLRLVAAPRLDRGGGSIVAIGPSASLRATRSWSFGAWALLGSATVGTHSGAVIEASAPYRPQQTGGFERMTASTEVGFGLGFEASFRIVELPRGALLATATPFFLVGSNGSAFTLPLGIAYRFQ